MPLPTCECVAGLPTQQQLANIYCALYTLAQGGGSDVTYPLSPTLGGTGVANAAGETITLNGGFALQLTLTGATNVTLPTSGTIQAFDQSLNSTDSPTFGSITATSTISATLDVSGGTINGLNIPNNGGNTLVIGSGKTFTVNETWTLDSTSAESVVFDAAGFAGPPLGGGAPVPTDYFGGSANMLGTPTRWMNVVINGTPYRSPLYAA